MKTIIFIIILSLFSTQLVSSQPNIEEKKILASVGGYTVYLEDFVSRYRDYLLSSGIKDNIIVRQSILNNIINEILLYYYDNNEEIFNNPEYNKELKWAEKQTVLAFLKDQEVFGNIEVTDLDVREAFYKSNMKIAARHLFAETEEEANDLYQLLQTGSDFHQLAQQVFTDSTLRNSGGYVGYFSWGDMDPAFEDAAFSMQVGEISKPVKTRYGYSIIKVEDRLPHPMLTETEFLQKRTHMERIVRLRKKKPAEIEFLNKLFVPNKMWFDEKLLGIIWNNLIYSDVSSKEAPKKQTSNGVCAKYGDRIYSRNEIEQRIEDIPLYHREKIISLDALKTVIKGLVIQDMLCEMEKNKEYDKNQEVKSTIKKYRNNIFLKYKRNEVSAKTSLPDSVIHKFYLNNISRFSNPPEMNVQEIIIHDRSFADSLVSLINQGHDFGELAEKHSLRTWSARNKGAMGFSDVAMFGMLKDTLWNSKVGEIVGPIEIENLYGIFRVLGKKSSEPKSFEAVKDEAHRFLKKEKSREIMRDYLQNLRTKVNIRYDNDLLSNVVVTD